MKRVIALLLLAATASFAQSAKTDLTVKSSPAEDALVKAASNYSTELASFNTIRQQAQSSADSTTKDLRDKLNAIGKDLNAKLEADKKYKPMMDQINALQSQIAQEGSKVQADLNQKLGPIQNKIATDNALIQGLIPVVRQENGFSDTATFDVQKGTWTDTKAKK